MSDYCEPENIEEIREIFGQGRVLRIVGSGTKVLARARSCSDEVVVSTRRLAGIVEWFPDDLVVTVRAGMRVSDLQEELVSRRQWLPIPFFDSKWKWVSAGMPGTVGGLVSTRLPTRWDFWTHGVRYWVLGMKVVLANGFLLTCGSRAVKNVAGYDMHKLFTGAWGALGLIVEVTFRVFPRPKELDPYPERIILGSGVDSWGNEVSLVIGRTLPAELRGVVGRLESTEWVADAMTGTFWAKVGNDLPGEVGWWMKRGVDGQWFFSEFQNVVWMKRIKETFDPERKFSSPLRIDS
ncbi:MAG: FAD-binding oxidoreductase [Candidatus Caldarchaeum sp.]